MRNLSYQLYVELPPSVCLHLEGPSRASASRTDEMIGCFTVQSKKNSEVRSLSPDANASKIFTEWHFLATRGVRTRAEWFQLAIMCSVDEDCPEGLNETFFTASTQESSKTVTPQGLWVAVAPEGRGPLQAGPSEQWKQPSCRGSCCRSPAEHHIWRRTGRLTMTNNNSVHFMAIVPIHSKCWLKEL